MADETGENRLKIAEARARVMAPKTAANTTEAPNQASGRDLLLLEQDGKMHRQKKRIFQMGVGSLALIFVIVSQTVATFAIVSTQVRTTMRSDGLLVDKQSGNTAQVALAETSVSFSTILRLGPEALANVKQVSVIVSTPPNGTRSYNTYAISGIKYFSNTSFVLCSCTDDILVENGVATVRSVDGTLMPVVTTAVNNTRRRRLQDGGVEEEPGEEEKEALMRARIEPGEEDHIRDSGHSSVGKQMSETDESGPGPGQQMSERGDGIELRA